MSDAEARSRSRSAAHVTVAGPASGALVNSQREPWVPSDAEARTTAGRDDGRAIIEVVFLAVLLLIPVVYILVAVLRLQSATLAVAQAARDAGRLIETSTGDTTVDEAHQVAAVALHDQHVSADRMTIRLVNPGADCAESQQVAPSRQPGATYDLCVIAVVSLPGVPTVLSGSDNTVTGVYTVHIGELREGP